MMSEYSKHCAKHREIDRACLAGHSNRGAYTYETISQNVFIVERELESDLILAWPNNS